jgi:hypothetical protein
MQVELCCPSCHHHFLTSSETGAAERLDRIAGEGPWQSLGDGETFEDHLAAMFSESCPNCGDTVGVSEESLGRLTREVLATW